MARDGVFYVPVPAGRRIPICFLEFATGRTLVVSTRESVDRDLMLMQFGR